MLIFLQNCDVIALSCRFSYVLLKKDFGESFNVNSGRTAVMSHATVAICYYETIRADIDPSFTGQYLRRVPFYYSSILYT
jgi:hypothetical protein